MHAWNSGKAIAIASPNFAKEVYCMLIAKPHAKGHWSMYRLI